MRFWRFLANPQVTTGALIEGWSEQTKTAIEGRHVLAIHDTSEIKFDTTQENRRGLGKVKKGNVHGVLLHAMIAADADSGICLGLVGGKVWTRDDEVRTPHRQRPLADKESDRWLSTGEQAKQTLALADRVTEITDREGDIYARWARTPDDRHHLLTRAMHEHRLVEGGTLGEVVERAPVAARDVIELRERTNRKPRKVDVSLRFGSLTLRRPTHNVEKHLPEGVAVHFVAVTETRVRNGVEPLRWLLLTTHEVATVAAAWQIVAWYKQRWIIEQLFRSVKSQGLKIEDSQLQSAERLQKLVAIAAKAAAIVIQLVQSRDGSDPQPANLAFTPDEIETLEAVNTEIQGKTEAQKNPHHTHTLAWAAWIIAKLGGWNRPSPARPPGPITFHNGLTYFQTLHAGWTGSKTARPSKNV